MCELFCVISTCVILANIVEITLITVLDGMIGGGNMQSLIIFAGEFSRINQNKIFNFFSQLDIKLLTVDIVL